MKKVLCILSCMNTGGAETFLMKIYRKLDRNKYQMDFCINDFNKNFYEDEIISLGGMIHRIPAKSQSLKEYKRQLSKIIQDNQYEYVLRITSNAMGFLDLKVAKESGAKRCIARSSNSSDGNSLKSKIAHIVGKKLYLKYVDGKIAPSDLAARYTFGNEEYENGNVIILNNGIDLNEFCYDLNERNAIRSELSIADKTKVVGHIGRFAEQKNHKFLIEIFNEYHKKNNDSKLLLVGLFDKDGKVEKKLMKKIEEYKLSDSVIFLGVRKDIPSLLSAFDILVFPSLYEGMPNTIIEAQATGLPCIISNKITKEADITGLLTYLDLNVDQDVWASYIESMLKKERVNTKIILKKERYDINSAVHDFINIVFNK